MHYTKELTRCSLDLLAEILMSAIFKALLSARLILPRATWRRYFSRFCSRFCSVGLRNLQNVAQADAPYSAPRGVSVSGEPILRWRHLKSSSNF